MKKGLMAVLLTAMLLLSACAGEPAGAESSPEPSEQEVISVDETISKEPEQPQVTPEVSASLPVQTAEPVTVYAQAVEDYLLPVEEYSWAREHAPEYVMIHFTSAVALDRENPYDMEKIRGIFEEYNLSVHYILDRAGTVYCYVPEDRVAWHAGKGTFADDERYTNNMNHYAIGIELAAMGSQTDMQQYLTAAEYAALDEDLIGFTEAQYESLRELVSDLCRRYEIPFDASHVIGHQDYASRKSDPGELFDWEKLFQQEQ